ncbi:hypothetical protein L228DRAFT_210419 [Xylona heveae TC161]|uniref:Phospholipid/glycerol acyltransferase domain-containing protein n=1 Tax=Xylona heveae (strain CBS 132557 / TC161) TaxID=1328760 RepID=A0A165GT87_XYLHT|nr:hypothetical protein L228DRAFT_210419 [Xylona heveae TC161]KZF22569.1 hypothetical protein L228DRAFT_210419 [Xylona heveae TC161]
MASEDVTNNGSQSVPESLPDLGAGVTGKAEEPHPAGRVKHGGFNQLVRLVLFAIYFFSCCISINLTQFLGSPLYFISKDYYYAYMAMTKQSFGLLITTMTQWWSPTTVRISGDKSVRGQLRKTADGRLECDFPERLVLIANHQLYSDWLYLWWIAYTSQMHGHIYIILKESLKYIPIIGPGMMFYGFVFLARNWAKDKPRFKHRLEKLSGRHHGPLSGTHSLDPMWLLIFPEGTNLSNNGRASSKRWAEKQGLVDPQHVLLPRSTGLQFCLQELSESVEWVYDCTVAYEGIPRGKYGQDLFTLRSTYFEGRPPKSVNMYWRRFHVSSIPANDPKAFEVWIRDRWMEKDDLMEYYMQNGRFPADEGEEPIVNGTSHTKDAADIPVKRGAGFIETEVRPSHWWEVGQIFVVLAALGLVINVIKKMWNIVSVVSSSRANNIKAVRLNVFSLPIFLLAIHFSLTIYAWQNMASFTNGDVNGHASQGAFDLLPESQRFSDIPSAIDIPVQGLDAEEAVEVDLQELPEDPTELCTLLENEGAARNFWMVVALAYAKQHKVDHAIEMLIKGLSAMAGGAPKEKLSMLSCLCWLYLFKSREAPRMVPEGQMISEARTKDFFLQAATATLNEASRINPSFPPLFLARGVLYLLRASLQAPSKGLGSRGHDHSERLDTLRQASKCFEDALRVSGGRNMMAVLGKARVQYSLGKYGDAMESYQEVLSRMPDLIDPDPRIGIGCCLWQLGYKEEAKNAWERTLEINPDSKLGNMLLGLYYLNSSSQYQTTDPAFLPIYKKAMTQYTQKAFKIDKEQPLTCATFGGYFLSRKAMPTVEGLARKAIELTDVNAVASDGWYLLARKAHFEGEVSRAIEFYQKADQARGGDDRGYLPAKFGVAQLQVLLGDIDGAKFRLEKILQTTKNLEAMALLGTLYAEEVFTSQASGLKEDKSAELKKATALLEAVRLAWKDPKKQMTPDATVLINLARLYEADHPEKSLQCLIQVEQIELGNVPDEVRPEKGEDEAAYLAGMRQYLPPTLLNNMGCFHYHAEKYDQARDLFQTGLNACVKLGEKDETADIDALVTTISYNLARTYEAAGLLDEAKKVYEGLLQRHNDYTDAHTRLAYIALRQSPSDEGPKMMAKLYQSDSTNIEVRSLYGWYLNKAKKRTLNIAEDQEQRHYKHTLQHYEKHDRYALTGMGNLYLAIAREMRRDTDQEKDKRRKMYEKAVEFFDKALQLDPKNAYAAQGIGIALVEDRKEYSVAVHIFSKVRETLRDASVFINLGHVYAELKQYSRAIENFEAALAKDRARDPQILACLGRVWLLKGKQERSVAAMKSSLDYSQRALEIAPEQIHFKFNVAFVQIQLAQLIYSLQESQRTLQDVQSAAAGLDEAIESFTAIAQAKNPPYPKHDIEQRANMGRNTMRRQLERAIQSQKEYEEKNAAKLQEARELREAELKRREEERKKAEEATLEHKRRIAEERQKILEKDRELAERRAEVERRKEEEEYSLDEETGEKRKKTKKRATGGGKRKKKTSDESESEPEAAATDDEGGEGKSKPRKKRKLERKGKDMSKFKSEEFVVDSDEDEDDARAAAAAESSPERADEDEDEEEEAVRRPRKKATRRIEEDEDEDEENDDLFGDEEGEGKKENGDHADVEMADDKAPTPAGDDEDDE